MNLVSFALRRPISLLTMIVAAALAGFLALDRMPRDIFPDLGVPVLYVAQPYGGRDPAQMEGFITNYYEYHFIYITGIEHVESKSIQGVALIKLQFHPGTNMAQATAETVSYVDRARAFMPSGTVPPFVMRFDAGSVPVGDLVDRARDADTARFRQPLQPCRDIDAVAIDVVAVDDHVAEIDTDAENDALVLGDTGIAVDHRPLDLARAPDCIDDARKFHQHAVACGLDDAAVMLADLRIAKLAAMRPQASECPRLIRSHQPRIACDIGSEDRRKTARFSRGYRLARPSAPVGDEYAPVGHPVSPAISKRS